MLVQNNKCDTLSYIFLIKSSFYTGTYSSRRFISPLLTPILNCFKNIIRLTFSLDFSVCVWMKCQQNLHKERSSYWNQKVMIENLKLLILCGWLRSYYVFDIIIFSCPENFTFARIVFLKFEWTHCSSEVKVMLSPLVNIAEFNDIAPFSLRKLKIDNLSNRLQITQFLSHIVKKITNLIELDNIFSIWWNTKQNVSKKTIYVG
jgi:uncharacterized protein YggT (Ycf19 family)